MDHQLVGGMVSKLPERLEVCEQWQTRPLHQKYMRNRGHVEELPFFLLTGQSVEYQE